MGTVQQPDRRLERSGCEVHVPLRRQVLVPGELLNRSRWRFPHRQMRAERVTQDVNTWFHLSSPGDSSNRHLHDLLRERLTRLIADHARPSEMPRCFEGLRQLLRQRDVTNSTAVWRRDVAFPFRACDRELAIRQIDVAPFKGHDRSCACSKRSVVTLDSCFGNNIK